jgi:hypothetical protein
LILLFRFLIFLTLSPSLALADSRDARERQELVKIFDLLTSKMDVTAGDGIPSNVDCIFSREWDESSQPNVCGEVTKRSRLHELLSIREALDPRGQHSEMFCDRVERDKQAQILAQNSGTSIVVANFGFSYPIFGRDFQTATVYYQRASILFLPNNKRNPPAASSGTITLRKQRGVWTYKLSVKCMS